MSLLTTEAIDFYFDHPVEFVEDVIGATPDPIQGDILRSVAENAMTTVRSGHGIGKSTVEAWTVIWFLCTRPFPKIPCTAPTQHQLFDILWAEISKWLRNNRALQRELIWTKERVYMKDHPEEWFAVGRTASTPDALQGFHAENVLYIIDEASGVRDIVFEPVLGALSTDNAKLLLCGNPTKTEGFFYDSHNKNRNIYNAFHVDGRQSPRVSREFVNRIITMYGEDSDVFRVRVAGDFPLSESDVFIPLPLIEQSIMTEYVPSSTPAQIHIGCDVARFGDDKTVIGYRVDEQFTIHKKRIGQDTMKTADDIIELGYEIIERYHLKPKTHDPILVKVDDGGVGGGVVDRLRQVKRNAPERFWWLEVFPVSFGRKIKHKYYDDSTTYMMSVVKSLLQPYDEDGRRKPVELILPNDDDLVAQLSCRKYRLTDSSKVRVESKEDMKKRGLTSPDEADCLLLSCLPVRIKKKSSKGGAAAK